MCRIVSDTRTRHFIDTFSGLSTCIFLEFCRVDVYESYHICYSLLEVSTKWGSAGPACVRPENGGLKARPDLALGLVPYVRSEAKTLPTIHGSDRSLARNPGTARYPESSAKI